LLRLEQLEKTLYDSSNDDINDLTTGVNLETISSNSDSGIIKIKITGA